MRMTNKLEMWLQINSFCLKNTSQTTLKMHAGFQVFQTRNFKQLNEFTNGVNAH